MGIQKERGSEMEIEKIARQNFAKWAEARLTKDPREVADAVYTKDNTFLPTMAPGLLQGIEQARGYFEHFLANSPEGAIREEAIQPMGDKYYSHNGLYDFEVDKEGKRITMECRFTFNWRKEP